MLKKPLSTLIITALTATTIFAAQPAKLKTITLFNGKDLKGWHSYSAQQTKPDTALFHIDNGTLKAYGKYQGYIISDRSFKDYYKLSVDFRWNTDSTADRINNKRNSGVMYNVPTGYPDGLWPLGIQFQLKENATGDFILLKDVTLKINGTTTEPGKSVTAKRLKDTEKPVGEWNQLEVVYDHGHCTQRLNGEVVNEGFESSTTEGRVMLLFEGFPIDFRNVTISTLP